MVSEQFARVLRASRDELNARFAEARQRYPSLAADGFMEFLKDVVDPLICAVDAVAPERSDAVVHATYDVALELVGQRIAGAGAPGTAIDTTWRRLLPATARIIAIEPSRVLASLSNAAHQLEGTPGGNVGAWVDRMARLAPDCSSVDQLLRVGQVAAWRAGLSHFRRGAIGAAAALPEPLALAAVDASPSCRWSDIEAGLLASEWFDPARPDDCRVSGNGVPLRTMANVGAFRGFGGVFVEPPLVRYEAGHFYATSAAECWLLTADLYGASFHRLAPNEVQPQKPVASLPHGVRLPGGPGSVTSIASSETTLAVTWSLTHQIMLLALA
ncbi:MAG TPA: hypothetical protein VGJ18_12295 [Gemmatimonadaceae bacterium]|jgi:hypothetical protein